jgi:hypothetical protein
MLVSSQSKDGFHPVYCTNQWHFSPFVSRKRETRPATLREDPNYKCMKKYSIWRTQTQSSLSVIHTCPRAASPAVYVLEHELQFGRSLVRTWFSQFYSVRQGKWSSTFWSVARNSDECDAVKHGSSLAGSCPPPPKKIPIFMQIWVLRHSIALLFSTLNETFLYS